MDGLKSGTNITRYSEDGRRQGIECGNCGSDIGQVYLGKFRIEKWERGEHTIGLYEIFSCMACGHNNEFKQPIELSKTLLKTV